jgi:YHS domain-containing protein
MVKHAFYTLLASILFIAFSAQAADPEIYSHKKLGAIKGVDVVSYFSLEPGAKPVQGKEEFIHEYMGATWRFSSAENRDLFAQNPEKYAPQYGGYCAFAVSHGFTKRVNPKFWHVVDDKLYLNFNGIADRKWRKDKESAIARADGHWPTVLTACEKHNNCAD